MSAKAVEKKRAEEEINHKISMLVPGTIVEGTVESLMPYGAFLKMCLFVPWNYILPFPLFPLLLLRNFLPLLSYSG